MEIKLGDRVSFYHRAIETNPEVLVTGVVADINGSQLKVFHVERGIVDVCNDRCVPTDNSGCRDELEIANACICIVLMDIATASAKTRNARLDFEAYEKLLHRTKEELNRHLETPLWSLGAFRKREELIKKAIFDREKVGR